MSDSKSFNQQLFWLEQEDESDIEAFIPPDTPIHSPNYIKLKKKAIKTRAQHAHNKTIYKQINELKQLQKDFGSRIDINLLPKNSRRGPVFELISGSKFVETKADEIKSLLEYVKNKGNDGQGQQTRKKVIHLDSIKKDKENNKKDTEAITYQNEILKTYNSFLYTTRLGHRNQLSAIQKSFNDQVLQVNNNNTIKANETQKQGHVTITPQKRVGFTDSARDPRLKRNMQQLPSQQQLPIQQPQQQSQPRKINDSMIYKNKDSLYTTNEISTQKDYQADIIHGGSSKGNKLSTPVDNFNQTSKSVSTSSKKTEPLLTTSSIQMTSSPQFSKNSSSSSVVKSKANNSLAFLRDPKKINIEASDVLRFSVELKTLPGKYLSSRGTFREMDNDLIWRSRSTIETMNLGPVKQFHDAFQFYNENERNASYRRALLFLMKNGSAICCHLENSVPTFIYLPNLDKSKWIKAGAADIVLPSTKKISSSKK